MPERIGGTGLGCPAPVLRPCGRVAFEPFRIECGWPEYGRDISPENLPQEVGRTDRSISFTKGCYLGQETVARIASRGHVNRTLAGLKFACSEVPPVTTELTAEGQSIGRVTSVAHSPRFGSAIALGYVRRRPHHARHAARFRRRPGGSRGAAHVTCPGLTYACQQPSPAEFGGECDPSATIAVSFIVA